LSIKTIGEDCRGRKVFCGSYYMYIPYIYMGIDPLPSLSCILAGIIFPGGKPPGGGW
jgi:hypothetical protein